MAKRWLVGIVLIAIAALAQPVRAQPVEIEYWQYTFAQRVQAIDELIKRFEAANPTIKVRHVNVPYDDFRLKIAAAIPAGQGPDVVQLYYGWLQDYLKAKLLQPLPADQFDAAEIEREFFPLVKEMKVGGQYYGLPTAVGARARFWNRKLFQEAGLDPAKPPATLDELLAMAKKLTKRDAGGNLAQAGIALDPGGQDHHWIREILIRQMGGKPYSDDLRKVAYDTEAGVKGVAWYTDLVTKEKVSEFGFLTDAVTAFRSGKGGLTIDGSFRLGAFDGQQGLDYGVAELPSHAGVRSNFASYWVNGITPKATGAKKDAAVKFLKFITTPEAMELWLEKVGELPARKAVAERDQVKNHPKYGAFIRGLAYSQATFFVNETGQRKVFLDMVDRIAIAKAAPKDAVHEAAVEEQKLLDAYYNK
jgi:multiple sugar transport system substrate-binding protein